MSGDLKRLRATIRQYKKDEQRLAQNVIAFNQSEKILNEFYGMAKLQNFGGNVNVDGLTCQITNFLSLVATDFPARSTLQKINERMKLRKVILATNAIPARGVSQRDIFATINDIYAFKLSAESKFPKSQTTCLKSKKIGKTGRLCIVSVPFRRLPVRADKAQLRDERMRRLQHFGDSCRRTQGNFGTLDSREREQTRLDEDVRRAEKSRCAGSRFYFYGWCDGTIPVRLPKSKFFFSVQLFVHTFFPLDLIL